MRSEDRERLLTDVQSRLVSAMAGVDGLKYQDILADSVYHETRRLKEETDLREREEGLQFFNGIRREINHNSTHGHKDALAQVVSRYAREICGNFDERVYRMATKVGPAALGLLINAVSPKRILTRFPQLPGLDQAMVIQGETEHLRRLHELGTVIMVPHHVSNLDSLLLGFAVYRLGLPPLIYGAGLNLFSNPLISYFMHNLGAYTVDRRKTCPLYKQVLKEYATLTLEYGYDNLFFPGGTRSRSGAIERYLKLGLAGTGLQAFINNIKRQKERSKIFFVPTTLSFQLVLEAETLIDDFLKEVGKSRYIISDDEFSKPTRILDFMNQGMNLHSKIYVTFGRGCDPFGNPVNDDGMSMDPRGRSIDINRYVLSGDEYVSMPGRDREYTGEVGSRIKEAFTKDNVVQSTNVAARCVFEILRSSNRQMDLMRLLRLGGADDNFELRDVYRALDELMETLRALEADGGIRLSPDIRNAPADDVMADALRHFSIYHQKHAIYRKGDRLFIGDRSLLFYYQNRLEGYGLEARLGLRPALAPSHRHILGAA